MPCDVYDDLERDQFLYLPTPPPTGLLSLPCDGLNGRRSVFCVSRICVPRSFISTTRWLSPSVLTLYLKCCLCDESCLLHYSLTCILCLDAWMKLSLRSKREEDNRRRKPWCRGAGIATTAQSNEGISTSVFSDMPVIVRPNLISRSSHFDQCKKSRLPHIHSCHVILTYTLRLGEYEETMRRFILKQPV